MSAIMTIVPYCFAVTLGKSFLKRGIVAHIQICPKRATQKLVSQKFVAATAFLIKTAKATKNTMERSAKLIFLLKNDLRVNCSSKLTNIPKIKIIKIKIY